MILYLTKKTVDRFDVKLPEELDSSAKDHVTALMQKEQGNGLLEWGAKIFYFDRRKCIQFTNFATRFTLFRVNIKKKQIMESYDFIKRTLLDMYRGDNLMIEALHKMFTESPDFCFGRLKDQSVISTLNYTQRTFLDDGYALENYLDDENNLLVWKVNYDVNFDWLLTMNINGKRDYSYSCERFHDLVMEKYGDNLKPHLNVIE